MEPTMSFPEMREDDAAELRRILEERGHKNIHPETLTTLLGLFSVKESVKAYESVLAGKKYPPERKDDG